MRKRSRRKIDDFGEHIPGARKDLATHGLRTGMEEDPTFRATLSKTWPKPPWEEVERQHILDNRNSGDLAFARAVRDILKTRDGRLIEQAMATDRRAPDENPKTMRSIALAVLRGDLPHHEALEQLGKNPRGWTLKQCEVRTALYQAAGHKQDLSKYEGRVKLHGSGPRAGMRYWEIWARHGHVATGETLAEAANELRAYLFKEAASGVVKPRAEQTPFIAGHETRRGVRIYGVFRKAGGRWRIIQEYESPEAVHEALQNEKERARLEAKWISWITIPPERRAANERRTPDAKEGTSNPNEFTGRFGFRGVQFGNWVEKERRTTDLHEASQALADLARVLHWPEALLALDRRLALAFGARGNGGRNPAKAHYETSHRVIAISKPTGPGSLAHEWFHGIDNICFEIAGAREAGFGTETSTVTWQVRERKPMDPFMTAFAELGVALRQSPMQDRAAKLDMRRPKSKPYWATTRELGARAFEAWVIQELMKIGIRNDYLANIRMPGEWEGSNKIDQGYPYPYENELATLSPYMKRIAELGLKKLVNGPGAARMQPPASSQAAHRTF